MCGAHLYALSAEKLAFNSQDACRTCDGTGTVRTVHLDTLVPDDSLTIDEGAVRPYLRSQLARAVRNHTTGVLYVLDEPSPSACIHWMCERFCGCFGHSLTIDSGATVIVIKHDLDIIRSADYIIDMGSGGGEAGDRIVATGPPEDVRCITESVTGRFI